MLSYIVRRILLFLPTLLVISWIAFGLSRCSNSDPVATQCIQEEVSSYADLLRQEEQCRKLAQEYGLNKPIFYIVLRPASFPDTLHRILNQTKRAARQSMLIQHGNWEAVQAYFDAISKTEKHILMLPDSLRSTERIAIQSGLQQLHIQHKAERVQYFLDEINQNLALDSVMVSAIQTDIQQLQSSYENLTTNANPKAVYFPTLHWNGFDNQYHHWISRFMQGDFGHSYLYKEPVTKRIWGALQWTLILNIVSIILAYLIAVPLGVVAAVHRHNWKNRIISLGLFVLYALPTFWVATMLIIFFTTSEYQMDWFPTSGVAEHSVTTSPIQRFWKSTYHLVLPIFCLTYGALAYIARQMQGGMWLVLQQEYIKTAKAKGLSPYQIIWKHGFRNALFPIVAMFASLFPVLLAGSVVVEVIFSIPGMGREVFDALLQGDWPIVYTVLMLAAILTMLGNLLADILFVRIDPRVRLN